MVKFIRYGLYVSALIPLIIFKDFLYPFQFSKVIVFRSLVEVLGVLYLILILRNRAHLPKRDILSKSILLFLGVFTLTTLTSPIPYTSFWGTLERTGGLFTFCHYVLYYVILNTIFTKKEHWHNFFNVIIISGLLSAIYGFGQTTDLSFFLDTSSSRISGTLGNPALFAGYELFIVFLCLTFFFNAKSRLAKFLYLLTFWVATAAVFMSAARGSILGYGAGILVFGLIFIKHKKPHLLKLLSFSFVGLMVIILILSNLFKEAEFVKNSRYLRRIANTSFSSATVQTRIWAWEAGIKGWKESAKTMVFGWGPENFNLPFAKNFNPKFFISPTSETFFDRAHNMFIEILVTMGILGLASYIYLLAAAFICLKKLLKNEEFKMYGTGLFAALVAYIIHNFFIFDILPNFMVFFSILGFISYANGYSRKSNEACLLIKNQKILKLFVLLIVIFLSMLIYKTNIVVAKANRMAFKATILTGEGNFEKRLDEFKKSLSHDVPGVYEYRHRLADYLIGPGGPSLKDWGVKEAYEFSVAEVEKNIQLTRGLNHIPYLYAGRLNMNLGYNDKALNYLNKALEISPTFIRTYYEIAQAYLNENNHRDAILSYQKALDLNPESGASHWYLGWAKINSGDKSGIKDAEKAFFVPEKYQTIEELSRISHFYSKERDFHGMISFYNELVQVALSQNNQPLWEYYMFLAEAYGNLGQIDKAFDYTKKAVEINPKIKLDAERFLNSLGREL